MIEKTFLDRVPTYPGRVKMTPVPGQANTYDMVRADSPTVEGTPIDKAAFDSIIQSRLTGRYYEPTVTRQTISGKYDITANPIPTSWNGSGLVYTSGNYRISTNRNPEYNTSYLLPDAFDGKEDTYLLWAVTSGDEANVTIELPDLIELKKVKLKYKNSTNMRLTIQGSADGVIYNTLYQRAGNSDNLTEYMLTSTGQYKFYKFSFVAGSSGSLYIYTIAFSGYDVATYKNNFTLAKGVPAEWTTGQRVTIQAPAATNNLAVISNTLNGVPVNTILQPSRRYELRYTGSAFAAKEV
jgi:hypothetical protein